MSDKKRTRVVADFLDQLLDDKFRDKALKALEDNYEGEEYLRQYKDFLHAVSQAYGKLNLVDGGGEKTDGQINIIVPKDRADTFGDKMKEDK